MLFNLEKSIQILERTPRMFNAYLKDIASDWYLNNEGGDSWSPYEIIEHLINGEKVDWIPRMEIILARYQEKHFPTFDRFEEGDKKKKTMDDLIDEFCFLRQQNLKKLNDQHLNEIDLKKQGIHPEFGPVTLKQLLSTWAVHDLNHIAQIMRVMAKQLEIEVGPWSKYLGILK